MKTKITLGIIGAGRIGKVHTENIAYRLPEAKIKTIADVNIEEAKKLADKLQIAETTDDYKKIITDKEINAVVICSPTDTHAQYIIEAAENKKDIFCEKPIDLTIEKIKEALDAVVKHNVRLMVGFNRRFDSNFSKVKQMVTEGKIGDPHILKITSRDPQPPNLNYVKISGGLFMDMAIHDFDMARFIVGSEVVEVFAKGEVLVDKKIGELGDIDTAVTVLKFANGALGVIDNSRKASYGYDQRIEIFGSKGMVNISNNKPDSHTYLNETGEHSSLPLNFFMDRYTESYCTELKMFIDSLINNSPLPVVGEDGLKAVEIALAAKQSLIENKPVQLR
ncbi:MAG: inositol 2-dehydrogenase [Ignavibacteria bacterium GWB2_35_6b]|nr:MAG: inositol 2-dehydrogenase [Ignavibacteria bacterium GWB2_35_6b]